MSDLVSVIIPTYSRPEFICRAIDSVLEQTYPNIEIIVVDDNGRGTDNQLLTQQTLYRYISQNKISYIVHDYNKNGSAARNTGLKASQGVYVNFLDDDDILFPQKIEHQVSVLKKTSDDVGAAYCNYELWSKGRNGKIRKNVTKNYLEGRFLREYLLGNCSFNTSSILFKKKAVLFIDGFDESFKRHQDYELMVRFFRHFEIVLTEKAPLLIYDASNKRINIPNSENDFVIKKKFLLNFQNDFDRMGIKEEIEREFWLRCLIDALREKKYRIAKDAYCAAGKNGFLGVKNYLRMAKAFVFSQFL